MNAAAHLVLLLVIVTAVKVVIVPALAEAHRNGVERLRDAGYSNGTPLVVLRSRRKRHRKIAVARALRKRGQL